MRLSNVAISRLERLEPRRHLSAVAVSSGAFVESTGRAALHLTLDAPSDEPVIVHYATAPVTAKSGRDFARRRGRVVFAAGQTVAEVTVPIVNDRVYEATDTFRLDARLPGPGSITASGTATILDDDAPPVLRTQNVYVASGNREHIGVPVILVGRTELPVTVSFQTHDGQQTEQTDVWLPMAGVAGRDYVAAAGAVTFRPGQTRKTIPLRLLPGSDTAFPEYTFSVALSGPMNATLDATAATATVTIPWRIDLSGIDVLGGFHFGGIPEQESSTW